MVTLAAHARRGYNPRRRLVEELAVSLILLCYGRIYTLVTDLGRAVSGRPLYLVYVRCEVQPPRDAEGV